MSIVRIALRICGVEAVRGKTLVGDNVLDSEIGALDTAADGTLRTPKEKQFVSVYTDDSKVLTGLESRSFTRNGSLDLIFEGGVASPHITTDPDTDASVIYNGLPATDANFEFYLDLTMRQITDALCDPENEWAAIFNSLVIRFEKLERARVSGDTNGVRLAAHQMKLTIEPIADPVMGNGIPAGSPLAVFFAKCESDLIGRMPDTAKKIALMRAQISGDASELRTAMRRYGLIHDEADAMLITPFEGSP
ncbi:hypothetical protein ACSV5K_07365 [Agrobacterium pusense]|uniref:hypothetical protein n=1 Tax=Agrobacterium pusense TaxID=648995 RepID=UPI003FD1211D